MNGNEIMNVLETRTMAAPPSSRGKRHRENDDGNQCDLIFGNKDLSPLIFSYIGVRDLYNFTMASKTHMKWLTHEQVVNCTMIQKGVVKTSMERLVALIKAHKIWTPSPLRMLRLMNGKRCEKCNRNKVNSVSKRFGVLFCTRECLRIGYSSGRGGYAKAVPRSEEWSAFIDHARIVTAICSACAYVFSEQIQDTAGERCGPLVSWSQMEVLMRDCPTGGPNTKTQLLDKLFLSLDQQDQYTCHGETIVAAFKRGQGELSYHQEKLKERKDKAVQKAKEARIQRVLELLGSLCHLIGDVPWKDVLLSFEFTTEPGKTTLFARFKNELVKEQMGSLARAPSKATNKMMREVAATLKSQFGILQSTGFHDYSFLRNSRRPFEARLWEHFRGRDDDKNLYYLCNYKALNLIQQGKLVDALYVLLPSEVRAVAVSVIVETVPVRDDYTFNLAIAYWGKPESATMRYDVCILKFPQLYQEAVSRGLIAAPLLYQPQSYP